jgi:hypothetical protein
MSMFDWQAGTANDDNSATLSNNFWIFWAVAIPLTFVVLVSWYMWWRLERFVYERKYRDAEGAAVTSGQAAKDLFKELKVQATRHTRKSASPKDVENRP